MSQTPAIKTVREFAKLYKDKLLWIDDIKSFAMYNPDLKYYEILDQKKMAWKMNNFLYDTEQKSTSTQNIQNSYLSYLTFESFKSIPSLFCPDLQSENRYNYIAFKDKLLNLDDFTWEEFSPDKYVFHRVPFSYEEIKSAKAPNWKKFLDEVLVFEDDHSMPDPELQKLLQQMFGYCLANTIKAQKAFFLFGASRAGKGVTTSILYTLMGGSQFVSNNKLQTLTTGSFALSSLVGKKANIAGEEESAQISADTFKELTAGDTIQADKKFQDSFSFTPQLKLIMSANQALKFKYVDTAIEERLITIPYFKTVPEHLRDFDLTKRLHAELPGIMKWALLGLKELMKDDYKFVKPAASVKAMRIIKEDVSNVVKFLNNNYEVDDNKIEFVSNNDLYQIYRAWCDNTGHRGKMSDTNFFKEVHALFGDDIKTRKRIDGKQLRGLYLKSLEDSFSSTSDNLFDYDSTY